ncbi:carbohydrate ABC transporter ATP-binding protein (CUT1 family) [Chromohalobacter marismortui]|uniref:Carbohydrate ABC transporter ATP-binding protein (CUT1 family) n=1 Tax=Chromohalobacter marismortui TaxID=42055 RepID=A0A4R7NMR2_9GAMM|nr:MULTISPECIES: sn-glycerol-3-phosphate ABC transporter ATP-binding protein UgpC [Chromohalobacter]MCI0509745.1 sn-glycerol-3-phosphate ABC transporter ATP-binding protein UgpC [Chromohalobacter sp.]MCI0593292.1 sn-glycerol-3-phosphate ABC transporter ATP-binding protein UgpC [Chromohalobacter sp.]TDU21967.1 carbohydrate ABC transporter ATP-binding protein (CUT1 family) [Chromohalobacter marismortui]
MASLTLNKLNKSFGDTHIIKDVDLTIGDGEFVVFVGPSGCGKSTLLRLVAGLESISDGELKIGETLVNDLPPRERGVGMVFQSYALYPHMTVYENMAFGLKLAKTAEQTVRDRVLETARILQLEELLDRKPKALSGGQRQRVAMGRAMAREPRILLFDEPLSNLDASLRVQMRNEIARLHHRLGSTVIYVTHDQVEAMTLADQIVVLNGGHIEQVGSPQELYQRPATRFVAGFIGSPTMNFLPAALREGHAEGCRVSLSGIGELTLPQSAAALDEHAALTLGVRPEHLSLDEAQGSNAFEIVNVEYLGNEVYVYLDSGQSDELLIHRSEAPSRWEIGQKAALVPSLANVHLFDGEGRALPLTSTRDAA